MDDVAKVAPPAEAGPDRLALIGFAVLVLIGGVNFPAVKATVQELAPMWSAGLRFTAAALILFAVVLVRRQPLPRGRALAGTLLFGALSFAAAYAFAYWAIERLSAGVASIILASVPLTTFIAAVLQGLERFRWQTLAGALLAIGGIAMMAGGPGAGSLSIAGLLALLLASICIAQAAVIAKRFPPVPPMVMNAVGMAMGGVILLAISLFSGEPRAVPTQGATLLGLAYLVVLGSIVLFLTYLFVLRRWTASGTSYAFVLFPVVAVVFAAIFQDERITTALVVGGVMVMAGVYVGALLHIERSELKAAEPQIETSPAVASAAEEDRPELAGVPADCVRCP
jgi:drug/metabolite transporter (DMT)-like permease